jgi:hypothetical protein
VWDRDGGVLSDVGKRRHLTSGLVEWFHRKGKAEHVGKSRLDAATVGSENRICFVGVLGGECQCRSETMLSGDLKAISGE